MMMMIHGDEEEDNNDDNDAAADGVDDDILMMTIKYNDQVTYQSIFYPVKRFWASTTQASKNSEALTK